MRTRYSTRTITPLLGIVAPLVLAVTLSGCLLGLGAAAGAAVGGCALLDRDDDDRVTSAELAAGIHEDWDTNDNGTLSEAEFDAGVASRDRYSAWSDEFDDWDENDDDRLTESEFRAGVGARSETAEWLDDECDDLGL